MEKHRLTTFANDLKPDLAHVQEDPMTDLEKARLGFDAQAPAKKKRPWVRMAAAAILVLSLGIGGVAQATGFSILDAFTASLADSLGVTQDLAPYTEVVGSVQNMGPVEVKLDQVIMQPDRMTVQVFVHLPEGEEIAYLEMPYVLVNGKKHQIMGSRGGSGLHDEASNTYYYFLELDFADPIPVDQPLSLSLPITDLVNQDLKSYGGKALFEFEADMFQLMADTQVITQDIPIPYGDGQEAILRSITFSPIGGRVILDIPFEESTFIELRGTNDLGQKIIFTESAASPVPGEDHMSRVDLSYAEVNGCGETSDLSSADLLATASSMTLTLHQGPMVNGQYTTPPASSDPFTITLT